VFYISVTVSSVLKTLVDIFNIHMVSQGERTHGTELSHLILYAPAFVGEHAEMIQQAVSSCLEQTMLCTEDTGGHIQHSHDVSHKI
jgi:hypothetical protein